MSPLCRSQSTSEEDATFYLGSPARGVLCLNHHLPQRYSEVSLRNYAFIRGVKNWASFLIYKCNKYILENFYYENLFI